MSTFEDSEWNSGFNSAVAAMAMVLDMDMTATPTDVATEMRRYVQTAQTADTRAEQWKADALDAAKQRDYWKAKYEEDK